MTRASSSIGSTATNSKTPWLTKLSCRRDESVNFDDDENKILPLNNSVKASFPKSKNEKELSKQTAAFSSRRKYSSSIPSFPVCSIGCNKNENETFSDTKKMFSKQWSPFHSDHETVTDFDDIHSFTENDASIDKNSNGETERFDIAENRTINREVLSPTLQLLHEVYIRKWPSNKGVYFLPSSSHTPSRNRFVFDPATIEGKTEDYDSSQGEPNSADTVQKERMIFRQQLRYEAIRKELFDNKMHSTIDRKSRTENSEATFRPQNHNNDADGMIGAIGCHAVSFWNYIPSMSNLLLNVLPEHDVIDDDSTDGRDLDEISFSVGTYDEQTLFSFGSETTNTSGAEDDYDVYIPASSNYMQENTYKTDNHDDASCSGSFMDQSHIYLMMTGARQERATSKKNQQNNTESCSTSGNAIDTKKISELTIDDYTADSHMQTDYKENDFISNQNKDSNYVNETIFPDFGWTRHFQPFGNHQVDKELRQIQWLHAIHQSFKDQNDMVLDSVQQRERRVAAKEALERSAQQLPQQHRFDQVSTIAFDLWG